MRLFAYAALSVAILVSMSSRLPSAAAQDDNAEAAVRVAIEQLGQQSYSFTMEIVTTTQLDDPAAPTDIPPTVWRTQLEGDVEAGGDHAASITVNTNSPDFPTATFERIRVGDAVYLNIPDMADLFPVGERLEPGWIRMDDLDELTTAMRFVLENIARSQIPSEYALTDRAITAVTELATETRDGVATRVFEIDLDEMVMMWESMPGTFSERFEQWMRDRATIAAGEFDATLTLWIDAETGQVMRGEGQYTSFLPYASSGSAIGVDISTKASTMFTIANVGEPVEIEPPI